MKKFLFFLMFAVSTATATGQLSVLLDAQMPVNGLKSEAVVGLEICDYRRTGGILRPFEVRMSDSLTRLSFLSAGMAATKSWGRFRIGAEVHLNLCAFELDRTAERPEDKGYKYAPNFDCNVFTSFDVIKTDLHRVGIKACFELQRLQNKETGSTFRVGLYTSFGTNLETPAQIETCYFQ
jgi:hypothetical protein